ncbi:MAG: GNAT family N-acetyltransferase [Deltaproteobacteria bacterium]|nr:GNAT family N-acetyltransferase [Deltaproteobacteria bacterium]
MSYGSFEYAKCFDQLGEVVSLENSGVHCLKLSNHYTPHLDLSYCYPFIYIFNLSGLIEDLKKQINYQCFYGVLNPWITVIEEHEIQFFDVFIEYKDHYYCDLGQPDIWSRISVSHRRLIKKALKKIDVKISDPESVRDAWPDLYNNLIRRKNISGFTCFSKNILQKFLYVPGAKIFSAYRDQNLIGLVIFYISDPYVFYHLAAYSDEGYELSASYGIFWEAIQYFRLHGLRLFHLGGAPDGGVGLGLLQFKKGFASGVRKAYFVGKVLDQDQFRQTLIASESFGVRDFFPPYRKSAF